MHCQDQYKKVEKALILISAMVTLVRALTMQQKLEGSNTPDTGPSIAVQEASSSIAGEDGLVFW